MTQTSLLQVPPASERRATSSDPLEMEYVLQPPPVPSIRRWRKLSQLYPGSSTLRQMEYEHLTSLPLTGKVLDVGGGANSHYRKILPELDYDSINIDPQIEPTWIVNVGEELPPKDDTYDYCISMNTLEHVYDPHFLIGEMFRVLKPGGTLHIAVPWMFQIHGHPDDFLRATPSWWKTAMEHTGFSKTTITPLVWGRASTASTIMSGLRGLFSGWSHLYDVMYATMMFRDGTYSGKRGQRICNSAVGHFISATK